VAEQAGEREVVPMRRLNAEDRLMLWPDAIWPQDVGALAVLDGDGLLDGDGRLRIERVRAAIGSRLHLGPRFRQRLYRARRGLGPPLWVDASTFDLADHVRVVALPPPADEARLLAAVERLRRRRLDFARPLWEMCFLPGLADRRVGLFVRMHHAMADGIAAVATLGAFLDAAPVAFGAPPPWVPAPAPTTRELIVDNLRRRADQLGHTLATLARPVATGRRLRAVLPAMRAVFADQATPVTSLHRRVGPDRAFGLVRARLDEVKAVARGHGATVNDILLAVTAGGLRELLHSRGERVDDLPVYVPVTLRPERDRAQARGNQIGQMIVPLPVGVRDPEGRLRRIAAATAVRKARRHPNLGVVLRSPLVRRALVRTLDRHPVSVTTADLPGPPEPLYLAGARILEVFPVLPLIGNVSLGVGALSYAGQFNITVVADRDACPDLEVFTAAAVDELRALTATTGRVG
jgi:WS/DGAT/MGAT family acyltransferase